MTEAVLKFHVLGPIELRDSAGSRVRVQARKVRTLLAVLLANANRRLSADALTESLWGARPPRSATANLRTYAWELRRLVPPAAAGDRIELDGGGYRLNVDGHEFDVTRFDELARRGHGELAAGATRQAAATLAEAVTLWRGDPFEDVAEAASAPLASRLVEQHWAVREDLVDAWLRLGEHMAAIAELRALTRQQPYRERYWEQLVAALHGCGRRVEALAAYRQAHRLLADELGIEPGAELRAAHAMVTAAVTPRMAGRSR